MRIAITTHLKEDGTFGVFETGIRQTAIFLHRLLRANGHESFLVYGSTSAVVTQDPMEIGVEPDQVCDRATADLVITVARRMSHEEYEFYAKQGAKMVLMKCGPTALSTMQAHCSGLHSEAETYDDCRWYSQVWLSPHLIKTHLRWVEQVYQCEVRPVPHVWEPLFVTPDVRFSKHPDSQWRVGIFEPNNTVTRASHFPLMAISRALERTLRIGEVNILNVAHLKDTPHFMAFLDRLGFYDNDTKLKTHLWPRMVGPAFLKNNCDLVVTHSWENDLHYGLYEALYAGYPLVHSTSELHAHGYYYPKFNVGHGAAQILKAISDGPRHDPGKTRDTFKAYMPNLQNYKMIGELL